MIKFSCKNCGQSIRVDDKNSGKRAKCPKCSSVIVVPGSSDKISFQCENCGQKIKVPKSYVGKKGKCPKCSNVVIIPAPEPVPAELRVPSAPIPPNIDEDLCDEQSEEYEESEGMDRRLIFIISGVAAVVVVGIIILAVVLRSSGSSPVERYGIQDNQQQLVNRNLQPQPATADTQPSELKAQELSREGIPSNEMVQPQGNIENTKILFRSNRDGVTEIYVMNPDGTGQLNITQNRSGGEIWPSWSPDGRQIAFCGHDLDVFVMNADGSEPVNLTNNSRDQWDSTENRNPSWSRSGGKLAFVSKIKGRYEICVVNRDGSELRNLTDHPEGSRAGALMRPSWSPDGRIVFSSNRDSMIKGNDHEDIYVMNADGTGQQRLTDHNAQDYLPSWSPNGDKIAFVSGRDGTSALYVMNSDGSDQKMLTKTRSSSYPIWSPDGKKIAFQSYIDRNLEIYIINADGSGLKRLTNHPGNDEACVWSPDGKNILFQSDRDGDLEIYMIGADGHGLRNLTNNPANDDSPMWSPFLAPEVVDRDSQPQPITSDSERNETAELIIGQEADVISKEPPPADNETTNELSSESQQPESDNEITNSIGMKLVSIPAGEFMMGSPSTEELRMGNEEGPVHRVELSQDFWMGAYEVTQQQYKAVMGSNPSEFRGDNLPVENVSWNDAVEFCTKLSQKEDKTYCLPTEAEWEYSCRAGTTTPFHTGETISTDQANYWGDYTYGNGQKGIFRNKTIEVGSFSPNAFGLYDMHGNVFEWCHDWYGQDYYSKSPEVDPQGPVTGSDRVFRGGSCRIQPWYCRSASRAKIFPDHRYNGRGFRVVLEQ